MWCWHLAECVADTLLQVGRACAASGQMMTRVTKMIRKLSKVNTKSSHSFPFMLQMQWPTWPNWSTNKLSSANVPWTVNPPLTSLPQYAYLTPSTPPWPLLSPAKTADDPTLEGRLGKMLQQQLTTPAKESEYPPLSNVHCLPPHHSCYYRLTRDRVKPPNTKFHLSNFPIKWLKWQVWLHSLATLY